MKTTFTLLLAASLAGAAPAGARAAELQPMVVHGLTGNMHIHQSTPIGCPDVDGDIPVVGGGFEVAPAEGREAGGGNKRFVLTRGTVHISPFSVSLSCLGDDETQDYTALSVQMAQAVPFTATPTGPGTYTFAIPPGDILLYEAATANGAPETGDKHPRDPVIGTIDTVGGTVSMFVVVATKIHVGVLGDFDGALSVLLSGSIAYPDKDRDGVADRADNCPLVPNGDQTPVASPLVRAPSGIVLSSCLATQIGHALAADICEAGPVTVVNNAPSPYPLGPTVVTWSAADAHGHVRTSPQTVTVVDTTPPSITSVPPDILLSDCGPASLGLPTATDDCGGSPVFSNNAPAKFLTGPTTVTWTATDISGNHTTATQMVTVHDVVPPDIACVAGANPAGHGNGGGGFFRVTAADHCPPPPTIRLGSFVLANGETVKITETGKAGVTLVNDMGPDRIRHFQVGRGQSVITATDGSGNVATAVCR
jgi:hypothetical protein